MTTTNKDETTTASRIAARLGRFLNSFRRHAQPHMHDMHVSKDDGQARTGVNSYHITIRGGQAVVAGRYSLEMTDEGLIIFHNGDGLAFFVRPAPAARSGDACEASVTCVADGRYMPRRTTLSDKSDQPKPIEGVNGEISSPSAPFVITGQGDYQQVWPAVEKKAAEAYRQADSDIPTGVQVRVTS